MAEAASNRSNRIWGDPQDTAEMATRRSMTAGQDEVIFIEGVGVRIRVRTLRRLNSVGQIESGAKHPAPNETRARKCRIICVSNSESPSDARKPKNLEKRDSLGRSEHSR